MIDSLNRLGKAVFLMGLGTLFVVGVEIIWELFQMCLTQTSAMPSPFILFGLMLAVLLCGFGGILTVATDRF